MKIDVCSGDDVDVKFITSKDLFLLPEVQEISLAVYPAEFIFAEKLETANSNVNCRLSKILSLDLIRIPLDIGQKTVYGYSITLKGLNRVKHLLFYECEKVHQSDCPIHDTILVDIRIY